LEARWSRLRERLEAHADRLTHRGCLVLRPADGCRVWTVRFNDPFEGRMIFRSIYVGTERQTELLRRTRFWLGARRSRAHWPKELAAYDHFAARLCVATDHLVEHATRGGRQVTTRTDR